MTSLSFCRDFVAHIHDWFELVVVLLKDFVLPSLLAVRRHFGNVGSGFTIRRNLIEFVDQFAIFNFYFAFR